MRRPASCVKRGHSFGLHQHDRCGCFDLRRNCCFVCRYDGTDRAGLDPKAQLARKPERPALHRCQCGAARPAIAQILTRRHTAAGAKNRPRPYGGGVCSRQPQNAPAGRAESARRHPTEGEGRQTKAPRAGAGLGGSIVCVAITGLAVPSETQQAHHLNAEPHRWLHGTQGTRTKKPARVADWPIGQRADMHVAIRSAGLSRVTSGEKAASCTSAN